MEKSKQRVQVLLYNKAHQIIRKIEVDRDAQIDTKWMQAIDKNAKYFEISKNIEIFTSILISIQGSVCSDW